jgi:hypothetical protein
MRAEAVLIVVVIVLGGVRSAARAPVAADHSVPRALWAVPAATPPGASVLLLVTARRLRGGGAPAAHGAAAQGRPAVRDTGGGQGADNGASRAGVTRRAQCLPCTSHLCARPCSAGGQRPSARPPVSWHRCGAGLRAKAQEETLSPAPADAKHEKGSSPCPALSPLAALLQVRQEGYALTGEELVFCAHLCRTSGLSQRSRKIDHFGSIRSKMAEGSAPRVAPKAWLLSKAQRRVQRKGRGWRGPGSRIRATEVREQRVPGRNGLTNPSQTVALLPSRQMRMQSLRQ